MSHYAYRPPGDPLQADADYVVVGSGAGGAAAAVTLARGGASVAIVEAGPWRDPADYPSSTFGAMRDLMDDWSTTLTRGRAFWPVVQARCVGGTTVINSAIVVRTPEDIFAQWTRDHGVDGERMARRIGAYQDRLDEELSVTPVPAHSRGRSNELAMLADRRLDFGGHVIRRNARDCLGTGQCLQGCRVGRKQSTNLNYVPETLTLGGHLLSCAPVDRVLLEGRRAVGVTGRFVHPTTGTRGAHFTVRARRAVLVAASVTHSPLILHRSGVRPKALGDGFRSHPGTGIFGVYDDVVDLNIGATQGWASTKFRTQPGLKLETLSIPPELVAGRLAGAGRLLSERLESYRHLAMWVMAVRAESVGTIKPGWMGKPHVRYTLDRADMDRMRQGAHRVAQMHVAAGARSVIPGIYGMPYQLAPHEIGRLLDAPLDPRCWVAICSHIFGGCTMGADPERSVVDDEGRVHGYEGLLVADASAIPTNLGVNPQHTIMAMSMGVAESLLDS